MDRATIQTQAYLLSQKINEVDSLIWQLQMKRDAYIAQHAELKRRLKAMDGPVDSTPYVTAKMVNDLLIKETGDFTQ